MGAALFGATQIAAIPGLVSTVIPVHNRPTAVREAVASVLMQDYRPIEVILVDDGSDDGLTPAVLADIGKAHPEAVRSVRQINAGPGAARECGRLQSHGEFIQYLDSDDVLLPGKFSGQVALLRQRPEADVSYGITLYRDECGRLSSLPHKDTGKSLERMFPRFLNERCWDTSTPLYRRSVCDRAGAWLPLWLEEDWEYDCRIASLGGVLAYLPEPVSETRDTAPHRLSRGRYLDPERMRQRAKAQTRIYSHAVYAGLDWKIPEMRTFSRSLFLLARQCGLVGLSPEARSLLTLSRQAAGPTASIDLMCYGALASIAGWRAMGRLAEMYERWRARHRVGD